jgi:HemX protein
MLTIIDLLTALLPLLYGLAAANYSLFFVKREPFAERTCTPFLVGVVGLHLLFLLARYLHFSRYPIASLPEVLTVIAFSVALVYLYVERATDSKATGVFLVSMAAGVQVMASAFLVHAPAAEAPLLNRTTWWWLHTALAVLGYSAFAVGAVYGLMFILLYRALKNKKFGIIFERLPSLDVLATMGMGAALLGWLLLTAAIVVGVGMSFKLVPSFYSDPKVISSAIAWGAYALTVAAYYALGWRGARTVYLSLVAFGIALLTMVGSVLPWASFHTFQS